MADFTAFGGVPRRFVELDAKAVPTRDLGDLNEGVREDWHPRVVRRIEQQEITGLTLPIHR